MLAEAVNSVTKKTIAISVVAVCGILVAVGFQLWTTHNSPLTSSSLPFDTPHFIGRQKEVQNISKMLSFLETTGSNKENPNMVNIIGAPGFGKSTLAIAIGNELLKRGIHVHYVDLNGVHSSQDATATILATVTNKLEVINNRDHLRWARSVYHKTLLILDNCDDLMKDNVRNSFLKTLTAMLSMSHSLRLLTTARYDYTLLSVKSVSFAVEPLSEESATQLLLNISPHTNLSAASSLANLTGRAALAMNILGALLKEGEREEQLANELFIRLIETLSPEEFQPEAQMRVVIASSFRSLSSSSNQCLAILAQMPGSFDESAAAAVLNINSTQVRKRFLKPITKRSLLEFNEHANRYHMHKLINAFVKEELRIHIDRQLIRDRLFHHYFKRLVDLARRYDQNPRDVLRSYDFDQHNFFHVLLYVMNPNYAVIANDTVRQNFVSLSEQAANFFLVRLPAGQLFQWYRAAREYAVRLRLDEDRKKYCNIVYFLTRAAMREFNRNRNITAILEEETSLVAQCSNELKLRIIERICLGPYELSNIPDSIFDCYHIHAQIVTLPISDEYNFWWLGKLFHSYGVDYAASLCFVTAGANFGDIDKRKKIDYLSAATEVLENGYQYDNKPVLLDIIGDLCQEELVSFHPSYAVLIAMGVLYVRLSNYESAILPLELAHEIIKDTFGENVDDQAFQIFFWLGRAYNNLGRYEKAVEYWNRTLSLCKKLFINDNKAMVGCHVNLANALEAIEDDEVEMHWIEAARLYEEVLKDDQKLFRLYMKIADWKTHKYCPFSAASYYYKAYRLMNKINETQIQSENISSSTRKELRKSEHFVARWAIPNVASLIGYVFPWLPEENNRPSTIFYHRSLVGICLVEIIAVVGLAVVMIVSFSFLL